MPQPPAFQGLGKALRWLREKSGLRQYQLADRAGVTKAMLSAYETEKQKPSIDTLEKLLNALPADLAELADALNGVNERPIATHKSGSGSPRLEADPDVYQLLNLERSLSAEEEQAMAEMLRGFARLLRHFHDELAAVRATARRGTNDGVS